MDTVARWHPWLDKSGICHIPTIWHNKSIWKDELHQFNPTTLEECVDFVGRNKLYVFCSGILEEFPDSLVLHPKTEPYAQKSGKLVALRVKAGRTCGFLIPSRAWGYPYPDWNMIDAVNEIFKMFEHEAITPSSLSEKVLRSTLPEKLYIYRPSSDLRKVLLETNGGGRIDLKEEEALYPLAYKYDINKAYLYFAQSVPDPYHPPKYHYQPEEKWLLNLDCPGYWNVTVVAHGVGIHPIWIKEEEINRKPREGETITRWMWREEIIACIEKGYALIHIHEGYRWEGLSDWLIPWAELLWDKFQRTQDLELRSIIKSMMVSFPGRCLRSPYNYLLIPKGQERDGDTAITNNWFHFPENWKEDHPSFFSEWYIREEYYQESAALTSIGAYIIMKCRMEMYRLAETEERAGNKLLSSYIDCAIFKKPAQFLILGNEPGMYKFEPYQNVWLNQNQFIGEQNGEAIMRAPGYELTNSDGTISERRLALWRHYQNLTNS